MTETRATPMRFAVEAWDPGYGSSTGSGVRASEMESTSRDVDVTVERPEDGWQPIVSEPAGREPNDHRDEPDSVVFVDGVRRIDARIWIEQANGLSRPGVCASVAAGAVRCTRTEAVITDVVVARGLYTAAEGIEADVELSGLRPDYQVRAVADDTDEAQYFGVHTHMAELETELSHRLAAGGTRDPVVVDGPLGQRDHPGAVGYVKTQHVHYLPDELQPVVGALAVGARTPVFLVGGRFPVWSWYLRLPGPIGHAMSGIVRLELPGLGSAETATDRATMVCRLITRFASSPHRDSRAPQNLYPIAGLERELRRRLGHAKLLERALRRSAA